MSRLGFAAAACGALVISGAAQGQSYMTFFGEDTGLGEFVPLAAFPNASGAQTNFLNTLVNVGIEDFEATPNGTGAPLAFMFMGAGMATLNGTGNVNVVAAGTTNNFGRYGTSGTHYWEAAGTFSVTFAQPVAAFGFFGIDIGDFNGNVTVTLATVGFGNQMLMVPHALLQPGGAVLYFGFIANDAGSTFTSITFGNTAAGVDFFGFDDFTVGSLAQVIPLPAPIAMGALGLFGVVLGRKRLRRLIA